MSWMTEQEARDLATEIGALSDVEDVHVEYKGEPAPLAPGVYMPYHKPRPPCWTVKCTYVGPTKYWKQFSIEAGKQVEVWHKNEWQNNSHGMGIIVHGFLKPPICYTKEETVDLIKKAAKEKWPLVKVTFRWERGTAYGWCDVTFYSDDISVADMRGFCRQFDDSDNDSTRYVTVGDRQVHYWGRYMARPKRSKEYEERSCNE